MAGAKVNGSAKWAVWLFRFIISTLVALMIADRARVEARMQRHESVDNELRGDVREIQTRVRIYHPGGNDP